MALDVRIMMMDTTKASSSVVDPAAGPLRIKVPDLRLSRYDAWAACADCEGEFGPGLLIQKIKKIVIVAESHFDAIKDSTKESIKDQLELVGCVFDLQRLLESSCGSSDQELFLVSKAAQNYVSGILSTRIYQNAQKAITEKLDTLDELFGF